MNIVAIPGALRAGSFNLRLARAAAARVPEGHHVEVATLHGIPLYDGDEEAKSGLPAEVVALKEKVAAADGLLLVSPEYNAGIPGVMKNGIDWMSRPASDIARVFKGKPVALMGATPGPAGTRAAQLAWLPVLRLLQMAPYFGHAIYLDNAGKALDDAGNVVDPKLDERLRAFMEGFVGFASLVRAPRASSSA